MQRLRWTFLGVALLVGVWGARSMLAHSDAAGRLEQGALAPLDTTRLAPWEELARLPVDATHGGRIEAMDVRNDSIYLLSASAWSVIVDGAVVATRVGGDSVMYVPLFHPTPTGNGWLLLRLRSSRSDTVFKRSFRTVPGIAYDVPRLAPRSDGGVVVVHADSWIIESYNAAGVRESVHQRENPPRYAVPGALAARVQQSVELVDVAQQSAYTLGTTLPPVRAVTLTSTGDLIALTATTGDATIAELVRTDGTPVATLWAHEERHPVFAVRGMLLRVRTVEDVTIIERQRLR